MANLSIFTTGYGLLSARQEKEFKLHQMDMVSPGLKKALVLLSAGIWLFYFIMRSKVHPGSSLGLYFAAFQGYILVNFFALDKKNGFREAINHSTPVFTAFLLFIFMTHYVPFLPSTSLAFQAQVIPMFIIIGVYAFEKISPTYAIIHGLLISIFYLHLRSINQIFAEVPTWQLWGQLAIANIMGFVITADQAIVARIQFKLQKQVDRKNKVANKLINHVFPAKVAHELKSTQSHIPRNYQGVTIIFVDIVNYTKMTASIPPKYLVAMLDALFKRFDHLAEKYDVEKIKTIGDAYMAACGCPQVTKNHAINVAKFALALRRQVQRFNAKYGTEINIRVGIHTGPVVAGVITGKRMSFDMWGNAVNLASRLQTNVEPGEIMVSEKTATLLGEAFVLSEMQLVDLKGVGVTPVRKLLRTNQLNHKPADKHDKIIRIFHPKQSLEEAC